MMRALEIGFSKFQAMEAHAQRVIAVAIFAILPAFPPNVQSEDDQIAKSEADLAKSAACEQFRKDYKDVSIENYAVCVLDSLGEFAVEFERKSLLTAPRLEIRPGLPGRIYCFVAKGNYRVVSHFVLPQLHIQPVLNGSRIKSEGAPESAPIVGDAMTLAKSAAREQFLKDWRRVEIESYTVCAMELFDVFEVTFTPKLTESSSGAIEGFFRPAAHYFVEKKTYQVIGRAFERG